MSISTSIKRIAQLTAGTVLAAGLMAGLATPASAAPRDCNYMGYGSYVDGLALDHRDDEVVLADAINAYRAQHGLRPLTYSRTLARPAMWASLDSFNRGFSPGNHVDTRGMGVAQRVEFCSGYTGYLGEINYWAWGAGHGVTPQGALDWWKNSPGHNARLLDPNATTFAVGQAYNGYPTIDRAHYTVVFGNH
ncbi:CAP domain-containing protein [Pseudonocardia sp. KRD-184]|uniref:CAP domain-containing protein n=1 Tax=Pseudonocardia oceani TaxID=2792013 RepID=A0ABS6UFP2_9PSEU|nr:CAP domain-containing protein [Pseudonocardia oceani]MBW0093876.1 CAP domain-containing protein [Pseudonocardia oceani]MBW0100443.1 CAP domain-containing protein [Pseudonocardia oceani]MBW0112466.1 CAP domain-containing protein [Pseudonocardia oceani]MBW0123829.1 CAP domain-containing protein [Pseudonocardia oceani]MBW0130679.1 CAP domain-containing protein [Pseudonocardia oceani]